MPAMLRALLVMMLLSCGNESGQSTTTPSKPLAQRPITPRNKLPPVIQPLVPKHGLYAAGGGLMSSAWRVVVDYDANTIYAGSSAQPNSPSYAKMDKENTTPLTPPNKQHLSQLANDAWTEAPPTTPPSPTADYDEVFVIADGDDTFFLQGFGPIRRPLAAKAITELRAAGAL
jgi:hypothetical protein